MHILIIYTTIISIHDFKKKKILYMGFYIWDSINGFLSNVLTYITLDIIYGF
jgi:hypothetical protein